MDSKQQEAHEIIRIIQSPFRDERDEEVIINWALKTAKELVRPDS